ncbi:sensor histidine kinase [Streptomyces sp. CA-294286]|uniref:sensor histidine kinase n=1 Tax=Streptomyces sp. CA-294286 TaxID=3240070 RepID=UPI003D901C25
MAQERLRERRRIAREIHDGAGHHMLAIVLHARHLAAQTPMSATAVRAIEELAVEAQRDVRKALGCLPRTEGRAAPAPLLSVQALDLAADLPGIDLTMNLDHMEAEAELPPSTRHAALRIVQESVGNAVKHGGGPIDVRVRFGELLEVSITDRGRPSLPGSVVPDHGTPFGSPVVLPSSGLGLPGMRRRAAELGGTLDYRELPGGGGVRVTAILPGRPGARVRTEPALSH